MMNLFQIKDSLILTIKSILIAALIQSCTVSPKYRTVVLSFRANVDGSPLVLGSRRYQNPNGTGEFTIENFKLYISNIVLVNSQTENAHREENSYHLLRFDSSEGVYNVSIDSVELTDFDSLYFSIGVDSAKNKSIDNIGDLDPNSQMAWNWNVGYKFVVMEGNYYKQRDGKPTPLVFHIGFSENYRQLTFKIDPLYASSNKPIDFDVNISAMFGMPNQINFDTLSSVTFNRSKAQFVAGNFTNMLHLRK
jgi:hypothetical protein